MQSTAIDTATGTGHRRAAIAQQAHAMLEAHMHFRGRTDHFDFDCRDEVLVVSGKVRTFYLKQMLQSALRGLDGVRRIDNQVMVLSAATRG